ncbi:hypothetical protein GCM10011600_26460 [Pseudolysinimonas yzui]|uniref:DUF3995 domain-containing protein n=1 Tax=Pseudolysinimonas yzui TaxID=2708254 RepID=A0A8J3GS42_9MICO|nr:hypothetical protein GCM10011600_26460 [Pseudolysinimonas yzui]
MLHRAPVSRTLRPALIAIAIAWAVTIVFHLVYLIREFLWIINDGPEYLPNAFGDFGEGAILEPLLFFAGAGALLVVLLPILTETRLLTVMIRAALAGLGGFVVLSVLGLIEAIGEAVAYGFEFGYFVNDWFGYPLVVAFDLTTLLVIGAVVSWLFASKKAGAAA